MAAEIYFNVAVSGLLTGLVYGLMAVGLSVIFGVVRVVNFAHGEMMTIAMYLAIVLFSSLGLDPLVMVVPLAGVLFALGYAMQAGIINPFITRPEHSQFILLVAADAYKRARSSDPKALADAIRATNITDNVSIGPGIQFNDKGQNDTLKNAAIQNRGGKLLTIAPKSASNAKPELPMSPYDRRS